ncbi:glycosyltransferase [Olivibacter sitiensis]|uniref:glycosyltransferase n=1 Tax=Olivibacter sitiensis TaxID=376470 RepID=UPI00040F5DA8|nr:glycosyltransferase [Olivibacter sitiensis]
MSTTDIKIVFDPLDSAENKYVPIIVSEIKKNGITLISLSEALSKYKLFRQVSCFHLNWFENLDEKSALKQWVLFGKKILLLILIKMHGAKVIWTMHNRTPHNKNHRFLKKWLRNFIVWIADVIVIHSNESAKLINKRQRMKALYIPHPNYIDAYPAFCYKDSTLKKGRYARNESKTVKLLFLGAIRPYKNIELLISMASAFMNRLELKIVGEPISGEYRLKLQSKIRDAKNIILETRFLPDSEISREIAQCDAMIMPYDLESSLNSGTVYLAFSHKKTVICPLIGSIMDIPIGDRKLYTYTYDNNAKSDHFKKLSSTLEELLNDLDKNPGTLEEYGNSMFSYLAVNHKNDVIGSKLSQIYFT